MGKHKADNLLINIQNAATELAAIKGADYVEAFLKQKYGVRTPDELPTCEYDQAFDDLDYMANDP